MSTDLAAITVTCTVQMDRYLGTLVEEWIQIKVDNEGMWLSRNVVKSIM